MRKNFLYFERSSGNLTFLTMIVAFIFSFSPIALKNAFDNIFGSPAITHILFSCFQLTIFCGIVAISIAPHQFPFRAIWHRAPRAGFIENNPGKKFYKITTAILIIVGIQVFDFSFSIALNPEKFKADLYLDSASINLSLPLWTLLFGRDNILPLVFVGPAVEEIMFRGVILNFLFSRMKTASAIFIAAILFAILHGNYVGTFLAGIFLSLLYEALAKLAERMKIAWQRKRKGGSGRPFLA
jgi:membrane protease YdiL (CAAX protease family)